MFRNALQEVRRHPGRIVATLIAIAISVAFMSAVSVFLRTEQTSVARSLNMPTSKADVVIQSEISDQPGGPTDPAAAAKALAEAQTKAKSADGVAATEIPQLANFSIKTAKKTERPTTFKVPSDPFKWSKVIEGAWPSQPDQIALSRQLADSLGVSVGGKVTTAKGDLTLSGITDDPKSPLVKISYMSQLPAPEREGESNDMGLVLVKAKDGVTPDQLVSTLAPLVGGQFNVTTAEQAQEEGLKQLASDINAFEYVLQIFAAIAAIVGMIIIANTFTILITQRRRQIGLLRAIGASSGQVRRQFMAEALLIGIIGSLIGIALGVGIAAIGSTLTGSIHWGLGIPVPQLVIAFVAGVVITLVAAVGPVWRTAGVKPLEALQPVLSADSARKASRVRFVVCLVLVAIGVALVVWGLSSDGTGALIKSLAGAVFLAIGLLAGAQLYVAPLIKLFGKLFAWTGPTARLATSNAARNPARAAATAVALMLAIGLIVTLQVGTSTARTTMTDEINKEFPVDVTVETRNKNGLSASQLKQIDELPGVKAKSTLKGGEVAAGADSYVVVGANSSTHQVASYVPTDLADNTAVVDSKVAAANPGGLSVKDASGKQVTLKLIGATTGLGSRTVLVNEKTLPTLVTKPVDLLVMIQVTDRSNIAQMMEPLETMMTDSQYEVLVGGGAAMANQIDQVLNILLGVITALLAVAVLIALVGVANTLGLSVVERTRESALLRALGMKRGRLRLMLLIEAIELALVGVLVGVVGGAFFGWLGIQAVFKAAGLPTEAIKFTVSPGLTIAMIVIAGVAAALASVLPGRRAALATPTEALAVE